MPAALRVAATIASAGVSPALTRSSISTCAANPKYWPPVTPPVSVPRPSVTPAACSAAALRSMRRALSRCSGVGAAAFENEAESRAISSPDMVSRRIGSPTHAGVPS